MCVYNFPANIFVDRNTIQEQINHLAGELEELKKAEGLEEQIDETLDIIHSAETLLRMLEVQRAFSILQKRTV